MFQLAKLFQMLDAIGTPMEKEKLLDKYKNHEFNTVCVKDWSDLTKSFLKALPYSLTPSQQNAVSEIIWDLKRPVPMNRLLQVLSFIFFFVFSYNLKLVFEHEHCPTVSYSYIIQNTTKSFLHV